jgi:small subunit ribosomal protein S9
METIRTIGRRKAAIARVYLSEGKGQIIVNNRDYKEYFPDRQLHYVVEQPLNLLEVKGNFDIKVNLDGGGMAGQAEALRLAIARALIKVNPEYKAALRAEGFVTRDPRVVERKKPGQPKARKRFQFSKR